MVPVIEQQLYYGTRSCTCYCTCTCARTNHVIVPCSSAHNTHFIHVMLVFTARISFMPCLCSQHAFHSCHACVHSTHFIHVMLVFTARISFMSCLCSQHTFHSCHACVHNTHFIHVMLVFTTRISFMSCLCSLPPVAPVHVHGQYAYWTCTVCMPASRFQKSTQTPTTTPSQYFLL